MNKIYRNTYIYIYVCTYIYIYISHANIYIYIYIYEYMIADSFWQTDEDKHADIVRDRQTSQPLNPKHENRGRGLNVAEVIFVAPFNRPPDVCQNRFVPQGGATR